MGILSIVKREDVDKQLEGKVHVKRKIKRRSPRKQWDRCKSNRKKRRVLESQRIKTEPDVTESYSTPSEENPNAIIPKEENFVDCHSPFTKQVLRVKSLAELGNPIKKSKIIVLKDPDASAGLVKIQKRNFIMKVGGKYIMTSNPPKMQSASNVIHNADKGKFIMCSNSTELKSVASPKSSQSSASTMNKIADEGNFIVCSSPTGVKYIVSSRNRFLPSKMSQITEEENSISSSSSRDVKYEASSDPQSSGSLMNEIFKYSVEPEHHRCGHCELVFETQTELLSHLETIKHLCDTCQEIFPSVPDLKKHMKEVHSIKGYKCLNCNFFGTSMWDLKLHQTRKHCHKYEHPCKDCDKAFQNLEDLKVHTGEAHQSSEPYVLCEICGKELKNRYTLRVHIQSLHDFDQYPCAVCKKVLTSKVKLSRHMRVHSDKEMIICEHCGKQFYRKSDLLLHMRSHTGEKPYVCSICSKAFAKRTTLRTHLLTHSGRRPYVCDICGKSFTQKPGLTGHRKSHPGDLPPMPSLFIDSILKDLPEDAFQNMGPKEVTTTQKAEDKELEGSIEKGKDTKKKNKKELHESDEGKDQKKTK